MYNVLKANLNTPHFVAGIFAIYAFLLSLLALPFATAGDQEFYIEFYNVAANLDISSAYIAFAGMLGTQEPGYFVLVYLVSGIVEKTVLMSLLNAILGYSIVYWLRVHRVSLIVILLLCFNFYLLVLFFSAERLKLAMMFFFLMLIGNSWKKKVFMFASLASQVQVAVLLASQILRKAKVPVVMLLSYAKVKKVSLGSFVAVVFLIVLMAFLHEHILSKLDAYMGNSDGLRAIWKSVLFMSLTFLYAKGDFFNVFAQYLVIIVASLVVGEERLVIFSYIIFMSYAIKVNRGVNVGVFLTSGYFFIKGLDFMYNVYVYGDGFKAALQG